ncbi:MAG TPA: diguanylate cyclase [Synergistaceae bacterium]|nr:diguanylate cyclase [Synergistaceae bacterium]
MRETPLSGRGTPQDLLLRRLPEAPTSEGAPGEGAMGLRHNVFVPLPQGSPAPPGGPPSLSPREGASFREAVEGMCLYALELDAQGGVVFCNAFLLHVAGWDLGSVRGKNWFDDLRSPDNPMPGERFRLGLRRGFIPPHHEGTFLSHWGDRRRVRWHNTVLRDDEGRVTGILSLGEDLTEQRRAEWEERKARIQAEALNKVVRAVGAHQDMDELLCRVDQQLNRFMEVPCLMVALGHPEWRVVYRRGGQDRSPEPFPGEWAFFDRVLREGKPLHLPDGRGGGALGPHLEGLLKTTEVHSVMAAPLVFGDRTLGVMMALSTDSDLVYSSDDMAFFAAAASPVALALENSRLFTEMGNLAMTDALTGVANRRSLFMLGEHEISRAVRRRSPISFFMLDLDHFKNVNDRHGHRVGDGVLRHVAQICRRSLREEDLLGRYGGEEFVVVLPDTGHYEAWSVAERLRGAVEEAPFHLEGRPLPITISVGVSTLPGGSPRISLETLLDRTDQALYEAKRAGRNAVAGAPIPDHFVDTARLSSLRRRQST